MLEIRRSRLPSQISGGRKRETVADTAQRGSVYMPREAWDRTKKISKRKNACDRWEEPKVCRTAGQGKISKKEKKYEGQTENQSRQPAIN